MTKNNEEQKPRYYIRVSIFKEQDGEAEEFGPPQNLHCNDWSEAKRLFDMLLSIRLVDPKFWPLLPTFIKFLQQFRNILELE